MECLILLDWLMRQGKNRCHIRQSIVCWLMSQGQMLALAWAFVFEWRSVKAFTLLRPRSTASGTILNLRTRTSQKCEAVPRRARIWGSWTCVSPNSRLESIREEEPPWRQPRGKQMVSLVNSCSNATSQRWHLLETDLRFGPWLPPGWCTSMQTRGVAAEYTIP